MGDFLGVSAAVLSSAIGGASIGITRFISGTIDPLATGAFRFGIGAAMLLPAALWQGGPWPGRRDWPAVAGLGLLFFALFPVLFNASLIFTTSARGALALSTLPLLTLATGAALGMEPLTLRKTAGVLIAVAGVALSLVSDLANAPQEAWRGDLLMVLAALCMAIYTVFSKPLIRRTDPLAFTFAAMCVGAFCLALAAAASGSFAPVAAFGASQWSAVIFLGIVGGALTFFLWSLALRYTTPTRVAVSVTVNPISASAVGSILLGEPVGWGLVAGLAAVFLGIWLSITTGQALASRTELPPSP